MILAVGMPGPFEIALILFVILLLFGAKRLPDLARAMGRSLTEFKRGKQDGLQDPAPDSDSSKDEETSA